MPLSIRHHRVSRTATSSKNLAFVLSSYGVSRVGPCHGVGPMSSATETPRNESTALADRFTLIADRADHRWRKREGLRKGCQHLRRSFGWPSPRRGLIDSAWSPSPRGDAEEGGGRGRQLEQTSGGGRYSPPVAAYTSDGQE
ncbi:hypothetical protein NL676_033774 [Syzygium grande]|nr:hypothetical protein NL676_033774 [Syzygium grande]